MTAFEAAVLAYNTASSDAQRALIAASVASQAQAGEAAAAALALRQTKAT